MRALALAPAAERDIESILLWTQERFGEQARLRYEKLLSQAILDIAEDPERLGAQRRTDIGEGVRTYHLIHSRNRAAERVDRVGQPRHFLLYRSGDEGSVKIARVLHDSMDLPRHLPEEYRS
jgi:toxin ParE1/3/4